jgi:NAD(P)-dependent dehydrogenase (short-subunit alcohol dehydrogenase family)
MRGLKDKRIIVVGGASGIGAATAVRLGEEGAKVLIGDVDADGREAIVARIRAAGGTAQAAHFDLGEAADAEALVRTCLETFGGVDGLANVGALLRDPSIGHEKDLLEIPDEHFQKQFDYNFGGYARTIRAVLPHFVAQRRGAIVNTSSGDAFSGQPARPTYASAKSALHALTRHVATRWGPDNIRCNAIAPGLVLSPAVKANIGGEQNLARVAATPLRRAGEPAELAAVYAFLLSDDAAWITGQVWSVNGGRLLRD